MGVATLTYSNKKLAAAALLNFSESTEACNESTTKI